MASDEAQPRLKVCCKLEGCCSLHEEVESVGRSVVLKECTQAYLGVLYVQESLAMLWAASASLLESRHVRSGLKRVDVLRLFPHCLQQSAQMPLVSVDCSKWGSSLDGCRYRLQTKASFSVSCVAAAGAGQQNLAIHGFAGTSKMQRVSHLQATGGKFPLLL